MGCMRGEYVTKGGKLKLGNVIRAVVYLVRTCCIERIAGCNMPGSLTKRWLGYAFASVAICLRIKPQAPAGAEGWLLAWRLCWHALRTTRIGCYIGCNMPVASSCCCDSCQCISLLMLWCGALSHSERARGGCIQQRNCGAQGGATRTVAVRCILLHCISSGCCCRTAGQKVCRYGMWGQMGGRMQLLDFNVYRLVALYPPA